MLQFNTMARKGLPKKYAKMGFKKGWAAYKRANNSRSTTRSRPTMARRRTRARRYVTRRARSGYRRRKGLLSGNTGNMIIGAGAGFTSPYIPRVLGIWTLPVVFGVAGYVAKKPALLSIAGYELGKTISASGLIGGLGNGGGGASQI